MRWGAFVIGLSAAVVLGGAATGCGKAADAAGDCVAQGKLDIKVVDCHKDHYGKIIATVDLASECPAGTDSSFQSAVSRKFQCVHNQTTP
ncbi:hypothetical protein [Nocardia sp. NPDC020380]|uniref:hypothetical protein n=1 Tax=Nocardia sp. NPDC020380 TaxID=3364309 RepID=UPI0037A4C28D